VVLMTANGWCNVAAGGELQRTISGHGQPCGLRDRRRGVEATDTKIDRQDNSRAQEQDSGRS